MKTVVAAAASAAAVLAVAAIAQVDEQDTAAAKGDADPATAAGDKGTRTAGPARAAAFLEVEEEGGDDDVDVDLAVDDAPTAEARARAAERVAADTDGPAAAPETDAAAATTVEAEASEGREADPLVQTLDAQRRALEALADRLEALADEAADPPVVVDDDVEPVEGDEALDDVDADVADEAVVEADEPPPPPMTTAEFQLRSDPFQSKDPADVQTTEEARAAIASDTELSDQGRAVYVVTRGGLVELRGEVPSERERTLIEDRVRGLVGDRFDVSNLLTVRDRD